MLVHLSKDSIVNALQRVSRAVSPTSPIPILTGIKIEARENEMMLTASNLSLTIQCTVSRNQSFSVIRAGGIVVPARYFSEGIRKLNTDLVTLEIKEHLMLTVMSGHSRIRLCGMDPENFPVAVHHDHRPFNKLRINNALLKSTIKQVAAAASTSEVRPVLTAVSVDCNNDSLRFIATDGIRLASKTIPTENNENNSSTKILIPAKILNEVSKLLNNDDETIEIEIAGKQIRFTSKELQIESALMEGTYPSIANVIPRSYSSEIIVDTAQLLHAVECVTVLAGEKTIKLVASGDALELLSRTAEIGDVQDAVPLIQMSGDDFSIALNGKYFFEMLRYMDSERVKIRFTGKDGPVVIIPEETESAALFLITPVRTQN